MTTKAKPRTITAHHLYQALRARLPEQAWALFREVRNSTGFSRQIRTADALAMSLWPSRGLELHGYEFKVSRSDWQAELKAPAKAEAIAQYCDRWWLVVGHDAVVRAGELPANWGLLVLRGSRLQCETEAPKLDPKPLDRLILAAICRAASQHMIPRGSIQTEVDAAVKAREEFHRNQIRMLEERIQNQNDRVARFERETGISVTWRNPDLADVVKRVLSAEGRRNVNYQLSNALNEAEHARRVLQEAVDALNAYERQTIETSNSPSVETP